MAGRSDTVACLAVVTASREDRHHRIGSEYATPDTNRQAARRASRQMQGKRTMVRGEGEFPPYRSWAIMPHCEAKREQRKSDIARRQRGIAASPDVVDVGGVR